MLGYITARLEGGNVLDLGCGTGGAMESFSRSFTPFGIEISSEAARMADSAFLIRGSYAINAPCIEELRPFPNVSSQRRLYAPILNTTQTLFPFSKIYSECWRRAALP